MTNATTSARDYIAASPDETSALLQKMLWTAAKRLQARSGSSAAPDYLKTDFDDALGAAYISLREAKHAAALDAAADLLPLLCYRAAARALWLVAAREQRRPSALRHSAKSNTDYLAQLPDAHGEDEYRAAELRADVAAVAGDSRDMQILRLLDEGVAKSDIAALLGITPAAITKRVKAIAARLAAGGYRTK